MQLRLLHRGEVAAQLEHRLVRLSNPIPASEVQRLNDLGPDAFLAGTGGLPRPMWPGCRGRRGGSAPGQTRPEPVATPFPRMEGHPPGRIQTLGARGDGSGASGEQPPDNQEHDDAFHDE